MTTQEWEAFLKIMMPERYEDFASRTAFEDAEAGVPASIHGAEARHCS